LSGKRSEAGFWAAAYWWVDALASPEEAVLYSLDSITTLGASGLTLPQHWRIMGALEAADGMLLFGISTAFMFAVTQKYWLKADGDARADVLSSAHAKRERQNRHYA
jgi:hypothetical protein